MEIILNYKVYQEAKFQRHPTNPEMGKTSIPNKLEKFDMRIF